MKVCWFGEKAIENGAEAWNGVKDHKEGMKKRRSVKTDKAKTAFQIIDIGDLHIGAGTNGILYIEQNMKEEGKDGRGQQDMGGATMGALYPLYTERCSGKIGMDKRTRIGTVKDQSGGCVTFGAVNLR